MLIRLDSLDHAWLAPYRDLKRTNQTRHAAWFIAEGRLVVERLLRSDFALRSVVLGEQAWQSFAPRIPDDVPALLLPKPLVDQLVGFKFHAGVIACGQRHTYRQVSSIAEVLAHAPCTVVVCPSTMLPDNLGAIARICSAFGVDALVVGERSADPFSRRAIRVSMGNIFRLPVVESESITTTLRSLRDDHGFHLIAATGDTADQALPMPRPHERLAIVLGNEAHGLEPEWLALCDTRITIPMSGETDSLNVAQAAAVIVYQFTRVNPG